MRVGHQSKISCTGSIDIKANLDFFQRRFVDEFFFLSTRLSITARARIAVITGTVSLIKTQTLCFTRHYDI